MRYEDDKPREGSKILFLVLGGLANLLLGFITLYVSRLANDISVIEGIARAGAANSALIARDVENLSKWTVDEVRELKERVRKVENDIRPFNTQRGR